MIQESGTPKLKSKDKDTDPTPNYKIYMDVIHHNEDVIDTSVPRTSGNRTIRLIKYISLKL